MRNWNTSTEGPIPFAKFGTPTSVHDARIRQFDNATALCVHRVTHNDDPDGFWMGLLVDANVNELRVFDEAHTLAWLAAAGANFDTAAKFVSTEILFGVVASTLPPYFVIPQPELHVVRDGE